MLVTVRQRSAAICCKELRIAAIRRALANHKPEQLVEAIMSNWSREVAYLREKTRQFRKLATDYYTDVSEKLLEVAEELEKHADELERGGN